MIKIHTKLFDHDEMFRNISHSRPTNPIEYILPCIEQNWQLENNEANAGVILCSIYTVGYNDFQKWINNTKSKAKIIVGGYHPSLCPEDFENYSVTIVKGPGESVINEAINSNKKYLTGKHLDVIPYRFDYSKLIRHDDKKAINIRTFSGCNRTCSYCCHHLIYPEKYNFSLHNIIEDIEFHNPDLIFITDSNYLESHIFNELTDYCIDNKISARFYLTVNDLKKYHLEKINKLEHSEVIFGLEKNFQKSKIDLLKKLNSTKIGCLIKTKNNQNQIKNLKQKYNWIDYFSEMWLMPFPKTLISKNFTIKKEDYHFLNPKEAIRFNKQEVVLNV